MSVPPGDRGKSKMQFVDTADKIEARAMAICRRWPKSWMFIITQRTIILASEVYEYAQKANTIIPQTEDERVERIILLEKAMGANYAFARKIERAFSLFPICGEKKNATEDELNEKSMAILEEFMNLCLDEEEALKGNIHYTRSLELGKKTHKEGKENDKE